MLLSNSWPVLEEKLIFSKRPTELFLHFKRHQFLSLTPVDCWQCPGYWRSDSVSLECCCHTCPHLDSSIPGLIHTQIPPPPPVTSQWPSALDGMCCPLQSKVNRLTPMLSTCYLRRPVLWPRSPKEFWSCDNLHHRAPPGCGVGLHDAGWGTYIPRWLNGKRWAHKKEFTAPSTQHDRTSEST